MFSANLLLALVWTSLAAGTLDFRPGGILAGRVVGSQLMVLLALYAAAFVVATFVVFQRRDITD